MARATLVAGTLSLTPISVNGTAGTADDMEVLNNGNLFIVVENTAGATRDITFIASGTTLQGVAFTDVTKTIPITTTQIIGPFAKASFNVVASKMLYMDLDAGNESDLKVQAIEFEKASS